MHRSEHSGGAQEARAITQRKRGAVTSTPSLAATRRARPRFVTSTPSLPVEQSRAGAQQRSSTEGRWQDLRMVGWSPLLGLRYGSDQVGVKLHGTQRPYTLRMPSAPPKPPSALLLWTRGKDVEERECNARVLPGSHAGMRHALRRNSCASLCAFVQWSTRDQNSTRERAGRDLADAVLDANSRSLIPCIPHENGGCG